MDLKLNIYLVNFWIKLLIFRGESVLVDFWAEIGKVSSLGAGLGRRS
jgi:hypothetical protein